VQQNLVLRWVREETVYDVWRALGELGLNDAGSREVNDVVSCPGTDSCKLGITSSTGLNQAVEERIEAMEISDAQTRQIHIKMRRLPQRVRPASRRRHRLLRGLDKSRRAHDPAYIPHLGGNYEGGRSHSARV